MATVQSRTKISLDELIDSTVVSGEISTNGHLLLITRGGAVIDAGYVYGGASRPDASKLFNFASPSLAWVMVHDYAQEIVDVTLFDQNGKKVTGEISYVDENTVRADFVIPLAGGALVQP